MKFLMLPILALIIFLIFNAILFYTSGPIGRRPLRILRMESKDGRSWFRIQQRDWIGLWRSCTQLIGWDMYAYIEFETREEAEEWINRQLEHRKCLDDLKICKREEVKRYK
jgi:hypothetical protein